MLLAAALTVLILEDFEDIKDMRASASRATAVIAQSTEKVKTGKYSGQLTYDFTVKESAGTSAATARHRPGIVIKERPKKIGVWVYGDGSRHWLRGLYRDGKGLAKDIDFTAESEPPAMTADECSSRDYGINWTGWKYVEAIIPVDAALPLT